MLARVPTPLECRDSPRVRRAAGCTNVQAGAGDADETGEAFLAEPGPENMLSHRRPAGVAGADEHHFAAFMCHGSPSARHRAAGTGRTVAPLAGLSSCLLLSRNLSL